MTKNFTIAELTHSETAARLGIPQEPSPAVRANLLALATNVLQPLRDRFGAPIRVSSGYRSYALNARIGGARNSQHTLGQAADLVVHGRNAELFHIIRENLPFDQLIWEFGTKDEPAWVHVSFRNDGKNRGEILVAGKGGYWPWGG